MRVSDQFGSETLPKSAQYLLIQQYPSKEHFSEETYSVKRNSRTHPHESQNRIGNFSSNIAFFIKFILLHRK